MAKRENEKETIKIITKSPIIDMLTIESSETGKKLKELLKGIWDNPEFILGVMSNAPESKWQKIIDFIEYEKEHGVETKSDDISLLSVVLKNEDKKKE